MPVNYQQAGLSALTVDPDATNALTLPTVATLYLNRISFESGGALLPANIYLNIGTAGSVCSGTFLAVYNCNVLATPEVGALSPIAAGTRLAITADLGATPAAGWAPQALTWLTGFGELPPGEYWLAYAQAAATTAPAVARGGTVGSVLTPNLGLTGAALRYATLGATAAATIVAANAISTGAIPMCMGLSL
jgi:hypothetical protein